jgi:polyhydroxyalkanoate synthesis regulator phasin
MVKIESALKSRIMQMQDELTERDADLHASTALATTLEQQVSQLRPCAYV